VPDESPSERFTRLFELLSRALALEGSARAAFVERECAGDPKLRTELGELLESGAPVSGFLEPPGETAPTPEGDSGIHRFGEFEIVRELGRGSSGVVYLARQPSLKREVALKVLAANHQTTAAQLSRFNREAQAIARITHPGVIKVYSDGAAGANHWFAMEYVPGHDLARELDLQRRHSVLPSEQPFLPRPTEPEHATRVARLVAEVARALHAAHEAGVVHRDVKPENLLLTSDGTVRIGDFGLARSEALGSITATNQIAGTLYYMSPEQAHVESTAIDHRTDVYSLGVVLYELCTLHRPYQGKTVVDVFEQIKRASPVPIRSRNKAIPRDLETICSKAMASAVDDRYRNAREFADDLERFLRHEAIKARPQTALEKSVRWLKRERTRIALAAAVLFGLWFAVVFTRDTVLAGRRGRLSVSVVDEAGLPVHGRVRLLEIDQVFGTIKPYRDLGRLPIGEMDVEPGYYRIVVDADGYGPRSYPEWIEASLASRVVLEVRADQVDGDMVYVEGGTLSLRNDVQPTMPLTRVDVDVDAFFMDRHEVTNAEYREFLAATGRPPPPHFLELGPEFDARPVSDVSWLDARAYAAWVGKRLPTFPEWTWAARGPAAHRFPWGSDLPMRGVVERGSRVANAGPDIWSRYLEFTESVGSDMSAVSRDGVNDLFGNVGEWTESPVAAPNMVDGKLSFSPTGNMLRLSAGFDWAARVDLGSDDLSFFQFGTTGDASRSPRVGFRCVRDIP